MFCFFFFIFSMTLQNLNNCSNEYPNIREFPQPPRDCGNSRILGTTSIHLVFTRHFFYFGINIWVYLHLLHQLLIIIRESLSFCSDQFFFPFFGGFNFQRKSHCRKKATVGQKLLRNQFSFAEKVSNNLSSYALYRIFYEKPSTKIKK